MNQTTKQRLTGMLVLLCLGVLLTPVLLDGEGLQEPDLHIDVPPAPTVELEQPPPETVPETVPPIPVEPLETDPETTGSVGDQETITNPDEPLDDQGLPQAWSVRLASFGEQRNAKALVERLREGGYKAYSRQLDGANGTLTAVYVGPEMEYGRVETLRDELAEAYGLDGIVVNFSIGAD